MSKAVIATLIVVVAIAVVVLLAKSYFARTHSLEVYLREHERQNAGDLQKRIEAVERLRLLGDEALRTGRYPDAERKYRAALKDAEQVGPENMLMASCYHDLGALYATQEKFTEAEPTWTLRSWFRW